MNNNRPTAQAAKDANGIWREPHDLAEHLREVASLARAFNGSEWPHIRSEVGKAIHASTGMWPSYAFLFVQLS